MRCLGCNREIPWNGRGVLAYTCSCGAKVFYDETQRLYYPLSLMMCLLHGEPLPHIDYYLGKSSFWSPLKEKFYELLRSKGAIWSWECPKCRERVVKRTAMEIVEGLYPFEIHPRLYELVVEVLKKGRVSNE